jgi:hypothetical protein
MNTYRVVVHDHSVASEEVVPACRGPDHQRCDQAACDRFEKDIEYRINEGSDCSKIWREVFDAQEIWDVEKRWAVATLFRSDIVLVRIHYEVALEEYCRGEKHVPEQYP